MKMHRTQMRPGGEDKSFRTGGRRGRRGGGFALGAGSTAVGANRILFLLSHLARVVGQPYEMHPDFSRAAGLTSAIIGAAIEVHRDKGPGLIKSIYQGCLEIELGLNKLAFVSQKLVTVSYKGFSKEEPLRFDVLVEGCVLVEAKAVVEVLPIHKAQLLSYLKLMNVPIGLLINFHALRLADGVHRLVLTGADR